TVDFVGDGLISYQINESDLTASATNTGTLAAEGGVVVMSAQTAGDVVSGVVNNEGVVRANSLVARNGRIVLEGGSVQQSGVLDVSSTQGQGGEIIVTGDEITVGDTAVLDASGAAGGGDVYMGGGWQGQDPEIRQATRTRVNSGAVVKANATENGDGGTIVVWSDVTNPLSETRAYGTFEAQGGPQGGDGGRIETSGHWLDTHGSQGSAGAPQGDAGLWLFD
ncbi:MAG: filamentous hemagglutinin, partial [bacterium]|nr:filamentous hemagglutinin [bacterium]